jgi:hypothetical protein
LSNMDNTRIAGTPPGVRYVEPLLGARRPTI